ncbi:hypothetical protein PR048_029650 [Dryococelus australis]|uniref:Uncharacterized protein n=1 Tax=Dryococelus australis TaxID=614101 RepID=A0ABQ9GG03_9NEOP|nr:hypothetical protein PR048_029650 [Dryococelus australis]
MQGWGKLEIPEGTRLSCGIDRHDYQVRKSGCDPTGNRARFTYFPVSLLTCSVVLYLCQVKEPFILGGDVQTVKLARYGNFLKDGADVVSAGWGITTKPRRVKRGEYVSAQECKGEGNWRSLRKPPYQRHRPAQFPLAEDWEVPAALFFAHSHTLSTNQTKPHMPCHTVNLLQLQSRVIILVSKPHPELQQLRISILNRHPNLPGFCRYTLQHVPRTTQCRRHTHYTRPKPNTCPAIHSRKSGSQFPLQLSKLFHTSSPTLDLVGGRRDMGSACIGMPRSPGSTASHSPALHDDAAGTQVSWCVVPAVRPPVEKRLWRNYSLLPASITMQTGYRGTSPFLMKAELQIVNHKMCNNMFGIQRLREFFQANLKVTNHMICAWSPFGKDTTKTVAYNGNERANIEVLRADGCEARLGWSSAGMQERGKPEISEKTRRQAAPPGTIPTCENQGATPLGIEPSSRRWEAIILTTTPPRPHWTPDGATLSWTYRPESRCPGPTGRSHAVLDLPAGATLSWTYRPEPRCPGPTGRSHAVLDLPAGVTVAC